MRTLWALALLFVLRAPSAAALEIANVSHAPLAIDPAKHETVAIRFRLSEPARVALRVFDGRDLLVREVAPTKPLPAGDAELRWDGRDAKGRPVPPEAYVYTLTAANSEKESVEYDLADLSGNEEIDPPAVRWDAKGQRVSYELRAPARVVIRAGLANGPLLATIIDWVARAAGPHAEAWNGKDESQLIDVSQHPDLQLGVQAWSLPKNAIIVLPDSPRVSLIESLPATALHRTKKREDPPQERALNQQPIERRSDVRLRLSLPKSSKKAADGTPIAAGATALEIDVDPRDRERLLDQRFEVGFFIDGKYMFENEVGFLPMTWIWDAATANQGVHYVTGNVWGYSGQFGTTTIAVHAAPQ